MSGVRANVAAVTRPGGPPSRGLHPGFGAAMEECRRRKLERERAATRECWRCFVAVQVGESITARLRALVEEVRRGAGESGWSVAWTRPEGWHVTVKFLGDVDLDRVDDVRDAVGRGVRGMTPFSIAALGLLVLPPGAEPRVLAVGLRDDGSLARLAAALESELEPLGFAREKRRFTPHLTLGRVRRAPRPSSVPRVGQGQASTRSMPRSLVAADWIARLRDEALGEDRIETVEMVRSSLSPGGSVYTTMAMFALGAGGAGQASLP
ncbi:MAG: RNA 2',3'-cyclic phosphodiesterase [Deltaproteobacteria bacterium]|nr:RNA 2',3'-cyclic phosphodiesterase [Deltaproteobacteria bacterium]